MPQQIAIEDDVAARDVEAEDLAAFEAIVAERSVHAVYQPIVELESGATVGWEALARGPKGSRLEYPDRLFGVAARLNRTAELDFVCRAAAVNGAITAGLGRQQELFVNVEPSVTTANIPGFLADARADAQRHLRGSVEITERALTTNPAELITLIALYRQLGWGIALDDVGIDPRSVSLMPFVRPDVIKLDMSFVQQEMTRARGRTVHAVVAEAERSGARVLAEGIETADHLAIARALGADLGQGWYFGRPGALKPQSHQEHQTGRITVPDRNLGALEDTPFQALRRVRPVRCATKRQLLQMSLALEDEAVAQGESVVLLASFQGASFFTPATKERYESIASRAAFVGAIAPNLGKEPAQRVRGAGLGGADALRDEWTVVVLAPHFAGAFAAHDLGMAGVPDIERPSSTPSPTTENWSPPRPRASCNASLHPLRSAHREVVRGFVEL